MYALGFIFLYIVLAIVTSRVYDVLIWQLPYKVKFEFAKKGYLLKTDPTFEKKEMAKIGFITLVSRLLRCIPLANILSAIILIDKTIKMYELGHYSESDKFYLSEEDKCKFFKTDDFFEKKAIIDKVTIDMSLAYFASQFKTSVVVNGILSLNCQLCPMAYTLTEVNLIARKLKAPITIGRIDGIPVALVGARIFRDIKTFDNCTYEISNDFSENDHFKIYLIGEEGLTDENISALIDMIRNKRAETRVEEFYQAKSNNVNNYLADKYEYMPTRDIKLEKRM